MQNILLTERRGGLHGDEAVVDDDGVALEFLHADGAAANRVLSEVVGRDPELKEVPVPLSLHELHEVEQEGVVV